MAALEKVRQIEAGTEPWTDFAHTGPGTLAGRGRLQNGGIA